jgi:hypothetical protein
MPDNITQNIDDALYKTYMVKNHAKKMSDSVMRMENRRVPENILNKIGKIIGKGTKFVFRKSGVQDILTELAPSLFKGESGMNALQLEKELAKTLSKINSINKLKGKALEDALIELAEEAAENQLRMIKNRLLLPAASAPGTLENPILASPPGITPGKGTAPAVPSGRLQTQPPPSK